LLKTSQETSLQQKPVWGSSLRLRILVAGKREVKRKEGKRRWPTLSRVCRMSSESERARRT
jgi:hypothetical protein